MILSMCFWSGSGLPLLVSKPTSFQTHISSNQQVLYFSFIKSLVKKTTMENIFTQTGFDNMKDRINQLTPETTAKWGKMSVSQMLAHVNVAYEMTFETIHQKPNGLMKFILKMLVKKSVVGPKPYPKNGKTAPQFIIKDEREFETEKGRLLSYMEKSKDLGKSHFEGKESHSFGPLTAQEWNVMFAKHLDHHLTQFGV